MKPGSELRAGQSQARFGSAEITLVDRFEEAEEYIVTSTPLDDSDGDELEASNESIRVVA